VFAALLAALAAQEATKYFEAGGDESIGVSGGAY
jgi:hypothetical protein